MISIQIIRRTLIGVLIFQKKLEHTIKTDFSLLGLAGKPLTNVISIKIIRLHLSGFCFFEKLDLKKYNLPSNIDLKKPGADWESWELL